jgi:hypothetical protein
MRALLKSCPAGDRRASQAVKALPEPVARALREPVARQGQPRPAEQQGQRAVAVAARESRMQGPQAPRVQPERRGRGATTWTPHPPIL